MDICLHCKRRMPTSKKAILDKRLRQDLVRIESALSVCDNALTNPFYADVREAIEAERERLFSALSDHRLLWSLYRRTDKGAPYYVDGR